MTIGQLADSTSRELLVMYLRQSEACATVNACTLCGQDAKFYRAALFLQRGEEQRMSAAGREASR